MLGERGTGCCSQAHEPSSSKIPAVSLPLPSFPTNKAVVRIKRSKSTTGCYGVARRALGLDRRWPALPTAQSWTCCSPLGAAACSGAQHWHSAAVWPWGWVVGKQLSCESCSRHSCKKSQTQGFFVLTQELPGSSGLLSYFSGMPLYFTPCVGALLTRAPGNRLLPLWHCGSASDEQTATWALKMPQVDTRQPTASSVSCPKEHSCPNKKRKSKTFILNVFSQPVPVTVISNRLQTKTVKWDAGEVAIALLIFWALCCQQLGEHAGYNRWDGQCYWCGCGELCIPVALHDSKIVSIREASWVGIQIFHLHIEIASEDVT